MTGESSGEIRAASARAQRCRGRLPLARGRRLDSRGLEVEFSDVADELRDGATEPPQQEEYDSRPDQDAE